MITGSKLQLADRGGIVNAPGRQLPLITTSRARAFRRCARLHHLRYNLGYRLAVDDDGPRGFGSLFHRALEAWWTAPRAGALTASLELLSREADADPFDLAKARVLLEGYDARWRDELLDVERVEAQFEIDLVNPQTGASSRTWRLAGKIDVIVRRNGAPWIVEHKTSSEDISPGTPYWSKLRLDTQVSTYLRGARAIGCAVEGCIYDVIGKPGLRPSKATPEEERQYTKPKDKACPECKKKSSGPAPHVVDGLTCSGGRIVTDPGGRLYANQRDADETPDEYADRLRAHIAERPDRYYQRGDVVRLQDEATEAAWELWQVARSIRDAQLAERHPRNPDGCFFFGRPCDFFGVCTGAGDLNDTSRFVREDNPHVELAI